MSRKKRVVPNAARENARPFFEKAYEADANNKTQWVEAGADNAADWIGGELIANPPLSVAAWRQTDAAAWVTLALEANATGIISRLPKKPLKRTKTEEGDAEETLAEGDQYVISGIYGKDAERPRTLYYDEIGRAVKKRLIEAKVVEFRKFYDLLRDMEALVGAGRAQVGRALARIGDYWSENPDLTWGEIMQQFPDLASDT